MACSAPKRARACEEETVFEGYLHGVTQMQNSGNNTVYFNCYLQTSRDQYRRCVVFDRKKHGYYVKAAADSKPLKISSAGTIPSKFTPGQLDIRIYYESTEMELKSLDFDYVEKPSITKSVEEALVPESVAPQRQEVEQPQMEQEEVEHNTVRGPVCGVKLPYKWQCSICNEWQLAFNPKATNHRCEACGFCQRVRSYVQAVNGTVMVNKGDGKLPLTLTSTVLMTYLSQHNLQELLSDVQLAEEHFLDVGAFEIQYNANNVVCIITTMETGNV